MIDGGGFIQHLPDARSSKFRQAGHSLSACLRMGLLPVALPSAGVLEMVGLVLVVARPQPKSSGWKCDAPVNVTRTPVAHSLDDEHELTVRMSAYRRVCALVCA
jgi:hypothetical protein